MSLWFYGYFNPGYLTIILGSIAFNYSLSLVMDRFPGTGSRKLCCAIGCIFNVGLLGYYKYYDFFVENINAVLHTDFTLKHILLPRSGPGSVGGYLSCAVREKRSGASGLPETEGLYGCLQRYTRAALRLGNSIPDTGQHLPIL